LLVSDLHLCLAYPWHSPESEIGCQVDGVQVGMVAFFVADFLSTILMVELMDCYHFFNHHKKETNETIISA